MLVAFLRHEKNKERNIEKYRDFHQIAGISTKKSRVGIFYGNKRLFLVIHCSQKLRLKFNKELFKVDEILKIKKKIS